MSLLGRTVWGDGDLERPLGEGAREQVYLYYRTAVLSRRAVATLRRHGWSSVTAEQTGTTDEPYCVTGEREIRRSAGTPTVAAVVFMRKAS